MNSGYRHMTELSNRRKIDRINDMWHVDAKYDICNLAEESNLNYSIHAKYSDLLTVERRELRKMQHVVEKFRFELMRFYRDGTHDKDMLKYAQDHGWAIPPEGKPHVRTDLKYWVDTNNEMIEMMLDLAEQNDVVETLERILKAIDNRSYSINAAIKMVVNNNGG